MPAPQVDHARRRTGGPVKCQDQRQRPVLVGQVQAIGSRDPLHGDAVRARTRRSCRRAGRPAPHAGPSRTAAQACRQARAGSSDRSFRRPFRSVSLWLCARDIDGSLTAPTFRDRHWRDVKGWATYCPARKSRGDGRHVGKGEDRGGLCDAGRPRGGAGLAAGRGASPAGELRRPPGLHPGLPAGAAQHDQHAPRGPPCARPFPEPCRHHPRHSRGALPQGRPRQPQRGICTMCRWRKSSPRW